MPIEPENPIRGAIGLCADCLHARRVRSSRDAVFYRCEYSEIDSRFPKYPRLPVLSCSAYTQVKNERE